MERITDKNHRATLCLATRGRDKKLPGSAAVADEKRQPSRATIFVHGVEREPRLDVGAQPTRDLGRRVEVAEIEVRKRDRRRRPTSEARKLTVTPQQFGFGAELHGRPRMPAGKMGHTEKHCGPSAGLLRRLPDCDPVDRLGELECG